MPERRKLMVLAIGGHGLSRSGEGYAQERERIASLQPVMKQLGARYRLLVVHGNGPQAGRLLAQGGDVSNLDIITAQTQGELGYLLVQAMPADSVTIATRVAVPLELGPAVKPIGQTRVASPRPLQIVELDAIASLLASYHVVAGGGGGIPLALNGTPQHVVVDKDWVALMFAEALGADLLVFATDVDAVYEGYATRTARRLPRLSVSQCQQMLAAGLDAGSMAPKLASAAEFVERSGKGAVICGVDEILDALGGRSGTHIGVSAG